MPLWFVIYIASYCLETSEIFHYSQQLISAEGILFSPCFCIVQYPDPCREIGCIIVSYILAKFSFLIILFLHIRFIITNVVLYLALHNSSHLFLNVISSGGST